jgi:hypothetical protein
MSRFQPSISATLPKDWFAKESMTFLAADGQANVIASSEPLDPTIDSEHYASAQGDLLAKEFPGFKQLAPLEESEIFGGRSGYVRRFEWLPPDGVAVTQIQLYYAESGRGWTATATTPSTEFSRYELDLRDVLEGLMIEEFDSTLPQVES